jgi:hypothetical protein
VESKQKLTIDKTQVGPSGTLTIHLKDRHNLKQKRYVKETIDGARAYEPRQ